MKRGASWDTIRSSSGSILSVVEKGSLVICDRKFSFSHRTSRVEPSPLLRDNFLKDRDFPGKIDNIPLPGVSLEVSLPLQYRLSKKSLVRFLYGAGPLATSSLTRPKTLAPIAKKLVKLISAVVSVGFSEALSSFFLEFSFKRKLLMSSI